MLSLISAIIHREGTKALHDSVPFSCTTKSLFNIYGGKFYYLGITMVSNLQTECIAYYIYVAICVLFAYISIFVSLCT